VPTLDLGKNDEDDPLGVNATMLPAPTSWLAPPNVLAGGGASPVPNVSKEAAQGAPPPPVVQTPQVPLPSYAVPNELTTGAQSRPVGGPVPPPTLGQIDANIAKTMAAPGSTLRWNSPSSFVPDLYQQAAPAYGHALPSSDDEAKREVLNKIASGEARSYNEMYSPDPRNPRFFNDFSQHPRSPAIDPKTGRPSDAAGLYQFLGSTWDAEARKLGLKDFSPASQDAAAWDLASTTYRGKTGRDLLADAKAGKVNWGALGSQWESLAGAGVGPGMKGPAPSMGKGREGGRETPQGGISQSQGGQAGVAPPDLSGLFRLALLQAAFPRHEFVPIQYDPYKVLQAEHIG